MGKKGKKRKEIEKKRKRRYVFAANDGPLAGAGVVRAAVLVDAPIAGPLRLDARRARRVTRTVVIGKVTAHKVLVRFRRSHLQRQEKITTKNTHENH